MFNRKLSIGKIQTPKRQPVTHYWGRRRRIFSPVQEINHACERTASRDTNCPVHPSGDFIVSHTGSARYISARPFRSIPATFVTGMLRICTSPLSCTARTVPVGPPGHASSFLQQQKTVATTTNYKALSREAGNYCRIATWRPPITVVFYDFFLSFVYISGRIRVENLQLLWGSISLFRV